VDNAELNFIPTWKPVPGYEGPYEVSHSGAVRSLGWQTAISGYRKGRELKAALSWGYPSVTLVRNRAKRTVRLHCIVCEAFHGPAPSEKHEVAHNDGLKDHSHAANLRWATRKSNHNDKWAHGTMPVGDAHGQTKVSDVNAQLIAFEYVKGSSTHGLRALAAKYGVSIMPIHYIVSGRRAGAFHGLG
jgi:hypothetical protein